MTGVLGWANGYFTKNVSDFYRGMGPLIAGISALNRATIVPCERTQASTGPRVICRGVLDKGPAAL